jgi:methylase of polypeptide subunit release factors
MKPIEIEYIWKINDLAVYYTNATNGGGEAFAKDYCNAIDGLYPGRTFEHALEWCSGPGFIGYAMLATGLCNRITFNDLHQPGMDLAEITRLKNPLFADKVSIYPGSTLANIPESEKFDLVVANPPHYLSKFYAARALGFDKVGATIDQRMEEILVDEHWQAHTNFYNEIKTRLAPNGVILIQENESGSHHRGSSFNMIIENAGLKITGEFNSLAHYDPKTPMQLYYLEVQHR